MGQISFIGLDLRELQTSLKQKRKSYKQDKILENEEQKQTIKVGVSSCLMGQQVRFDSGHKKNSYINDSLTTYFDFIPFCPEVDIGLGVPREPIRLVNLDDDIRCIGTKTQDLDVTEKLKQSADRQKLWHKDLCGYILKKDSPSCGMERVKVYKGNFPERNGSGLYAEKMMANFPYMPVEEEGRLGDATLRENFIRRVYIYSRWRELSETRFSYGNLQKFHARHKYIFMSHNQVLARELGGWLSKNGQLDSEDLKTTYLLKMTELLKQAATRRNHTNTLQHIQGYLKDELTRADKQELTENIEEYRKGRLPLIVPITLLRHHFMHHPNEYIGESYYLKPYPGELMLMNGV